LGLKQYSSFIFCSYAWASLALMSIRVIGRNERANLSRTGETGFLFKFTHIVADKPYREKCFKAGV
jgi:hypothetical protein